MTSLGAEVRVVQIEPDVAWIHFSRTPADDRDRYPLLHRTVINWLADNSKYGLVDIQSVVCHGRMVGLAVSLTTKRIGCPPDWQVAFDQAALARYGVEYLEAVFSEALTFVNSHASTAGKLVLINRRHATLFLDRRARQVRMLTSEQAWTLLSRQRQQEFDAWLASDQQGFWGAELPDTFSWQG